MSRYLLAPGRKPMSNQRKDSPQAHSAEPMSVLGFLAAAHVTHRKAPLSRGRTHHSSIMEHFLQSVFHTSTLQDHIQLEGSREWWVTHRQGTSDPPSLSTRERYFSQYH